MLRTGVRESIVVVIGASSGMGRAICLALANAGATVVACARRVEALDELRSESQAVALSGTIEAIPMDVRNNESVQTGLRDIVTRHGRIDTLIYAAGINVPQRAVQQLSPADWNDIMTTNLTGAWLCTQAVLPLMQEQDDGLIIYISSVSAIRGDASGVAYQASKRGLDGIVAGIQHELGAGPVRLTVIYPGLCDTPLIDRRPVAPSPQERADALKPEDIADLCLYIASTPTHIHLPEVVVTPKRQDWRNPK